MLQKMFVNKTWQVFLILGLATPIIIISQFWQWLSIGNTYCSGTGTGLNYATLACHEEIWLPVGLGIQFAYVLVIVGLIVFWIQNIKVKITLVFCLLTSLILINTFYNPEVFSFWLMNIARDRSIA